MTVQSLGLADRGGSHGRCVHSTFRYPESSVTEVGAKELEKVTRAEVDEDHEPALIGSSGAT